MTTETPATSGCGCGCGTPSREQLLPDLSVPGARATASAGTGRHAIEQIRVPAGTFTMGDSSGAASARWKTAENPKLSASVT